MAKRIVTLKIDDDKIAQAITGYKEYVEIMHKQRASFITDEELATKQAKEQNERWMAWYHLADSCIENKDNYCVGTMICNADERCLTVEAIHNCIEILGLNLNEVEDYDM